MKTRFIATLFALALAAGAASAQDKDQEKDAQTKEREAAAAQLDKFIVDLFNVHQGNTLCMLGNVPVPVVRSMVLEQLKTSGVTGSATPLQVETAIWTRFPCPFSPYRPELLRATAKDTEGAWLFPHDSQPYRYGPKSPQQPTDPAKAIACEAVGFFPNGELRTGAVLGAKRACPFRKAADLNPARKAPRVASWAMVSDGRIRITRSDLKDYVEEWDVYLATKTFHALNMEIMAGDLVMFQRRGQGNEVNAATEFRHLQRLK